MKTHREELAESFVTNQGNIDKKSIVKAYTIQTQLKKGIQIDGYIEKDGLIKLVCGFSGCVESKINQLANDATLAEFRKIIRE